jgi:CBS domain-containing protein
LTEWRPARFDATLLSQKGPVARTSETVRAFDASENNPSRPMTKESNLPKNAETAKTPPLKTIAVEKSGALDPGDTVQTAGERLRENRTDRWPVAEGRKLVGVIGERNPDWQIGGRGHDPKNWKVSQIMSRELLFCYEDEDCATARQFMEDRGLRFLPVVDRAMRIVGIFSREEIEEKSRAAAGAATSGKDES